MARLTLTIDIPGWTVEQLKKAVADLDEVHSGEGQGINPDAVNARDVLTIMFCGELGVQEIVVHQGMMDD